MYDSVSMCCIQGAMSFSPTEKSPVDAKISGEINGQLMVPRQFSALLSFLELENVSQITDKYLKLVFGLSVETENDQTFSFTRRTHFPSIAEFLVHGGNTMAKNQIPIAFQFGGMVICHCFFNCQQPSAIHQP